MSEATYKKEEQEQRLALEKIMKPTFMKANKSCMKMMFSLEKFAKTKVEAGILMILC